MKYTAALLLLNCMIFAAYAVPHIDDPVRLIGVAMGSETAGVPVSMDSLRPGLITYMFGHAGISHLVVNMVMLAMVGRGLEAKAGVRVIPIYLTGGVLGALAHLTYSAMVAPGFDASLIGASAAVSGVFGAAAVYRTVSAGDITYFILVFNIVPIFGIATGIMSDDGVSYVSHVGGMVAGMIVGACFVAAGYICSRRAGAGRAWSSPVPNSNY